MNCYLCKDAGYSEIPAHRDLGNGKGVCRFHYEGSMMPTTTLGVVIPAQAGIHSVRAVHEPLKERTMAAKIKIDDNELRRLHAQGLSDMEIGKKLGCCGVTIGANRHRLGLAPAQRSGPKGPRKPNGNGTVGDAMPRISRRPLLPKVQRTAARIEPSGKITITVCPDFVDGIWARLSPQEKAELLNGLGSIAKSPDR